MWRGTNFPSTGCRQLTCGLYLDAYWHQDGQRPHQETYVRTKKVVNHSENAQMSKWISCDMTDTIRTAAVGGLLADVTQTHRRNKVWVLILELAPTDKQKSVTPSRSHSLMDAKHLYSTSASNKRLTKQYFFFIFGKLFPPVLGISLSATQYTSFPRHCYRVLPWRLPARSEHSQ